MHFIYLVLMLAPNFYSVRSDRYYLDIGTGLSSSLSGAGDVELSTRITKDKKYLTPIEIIALDGYPAEIHLVTTLDGYILSVFRIPGKNGSKPVFIHHGFQESGVDFVASGRGRALPYILHDNGYDVWLANARGNTYSRQHINLTYNDPKFWDYCETEIGIYDLPAAIDYITNLTGKRLFYIGHSMGGTYINILGIERPDVGMKVKAAIGIAPATYVNHIKSPLLYVFAPVYRLFYRITSALNIHTYLARGPLLDSFFEYFCNPAITRHLVCHTLIYLIAGYSPKQLNSAIVPALVNKFPSGASIKLYVHVLQQMHSTKTKFNKFDYGKKKNLMLYGSKLPPAYDLSKMKIPTAVFWAKNDIVVVPRDIKDYYNQLPVKLGIYQVQDDYFNHLDYVFGKDAHTLVYSTILEIMSNFDAANANDSI